MNAASRRGGSDAPSHSYETSASDAVAGGDARDVLPRKQAEQHALDRDTLVEQFMFDGRRARRRCERAAKQPFALAVVGEPLLDIARQIARLRRRRHREPPHDRVRDCRRACRCRWLRADR